MVPEFPDVRPLALDDLGMLAERLDNTVVGTCDLSPASLYIWRDCDRPSLTRLGDSLCILMEPHTEPAYFLEPVGGDQLTMTVRACLARTNRLSRVGKRLADTLRAQGFDVRPVRDRFDYIYRRADLAELRGKEFDGKRNQVRRFAATQESHRFCPLERSMFSEATKLFEKWTQRDNKRLRVTASSPSSAHDCQRRALERAFEEYARLGLVGGAMLVGGELQGFIIVSTGPARSALVHFQYANTELPGIYQALFHEACRGLLDGYTYVNLEEDLGVPGLRRAKLSYHPCWLEEKFDVCLGGPELATDSARPPTPRSLVSRVQG